MVVRILLLFIFVINITALQLTLLKFKADYFNPKYATFFKMSVKKYNRHSLYYLTYEIETLAAVGNNVTISILGYEYISGRYIPTPFILKYKFCEFFDEPLIGQLISKSLPSNLKCPFPKGYYLISNITLNFDHFPFLPIFTWSDLRAQGRLDINVTKTSTEEVLVFAYGLGVITQSLESKSIKIQGRKPQAIVSRTLKENLLQN